MNSPQENDLYREDRRALLSYYNSQCMTHGGYVISIVVGLSVLISRFDVFINKNMTCVFFAIIVGLFLLLFYLGCGTLYWGFLATAVIYLPVTKLSEKEEKLSEEEKIEPTVMYVLHRASYKRVKKIHPNIVEVKNIPRSLLIFLTNKKTCHYCVTVNKRDSMYCFKCGKKIS